MTSHLFAQKTQWASSVINYSSQAGDDVFSAKQVLGEPNSMAIAGYNGTAWQSKDDTRKEFLHVAFASPMKIKQVIVAESYNPGGVCRILLYDNAGAEYEVFKAKADTLIEQNRFFIAKFDQTTYDVVSVKVFIDCRITPGVNQIDAIGISDSDVEVKVQTKARIADIKYYSTAERLDENVNSKYTEVGPMISPDGKMLYVNRKDYPPHVNDDEIWYSELIDGKWSLLKNIGSPLNTSFSNAVEASTPDGNTMILINQYFKGTENTGSGFSITHRIKGGWSFPENARVKKFVNNDRYTGFYLANTGNTIITQLRKEGTKGESDLYVMFAQKDGTWSEPLRMGDSINTLGAECTPFLASDNKTLYFSSDGLNGYGSNDIYMSRRKDDTWQNWTTPLNIGSAVNSDAWDAYYSVPASGDYAYFVKGGDIYRIRLTEEVKPLPVTLVYGTVYNQKTHEHIAEAAINYQYLSDGKTAGVARTNPENGQYKIVLPFGYSYGFQAQAEGFIAVSDNLDMTQLKEYAEVKRDLYLVPIEVGQTVRLNNIFFDFAKSILRSESFAELDRVVELLRNNPSLEIELSGHTDNVGADDANLSLSDARARAVREYITSKGVAAERLSSRGWGEVKPVSTNDTEEGRQLNRRVEFVILKK